MNDVVEISGGYILIFLVVLNEVEVGLVVLSLVDGSGLQMEREARDIQQRCPGRACESPPTRRR